MKAFAILVLAMVFSIPALAANCPDLMQEIDDRLAAGPALEMDEVERVIELRTEGEIAHQTGDHGDATEALEEAIAILDAAE